MGESRRNGYRCVDSTNGSVSLPQVDRLSRVKVAERLSLARRPSYFDVANSGLSAQAKMNAWIVGIEVATLRLNSTGDFVGADHGGDPRPVSIPSFVQQDLKPYPISTFRYAIHEQVGGAITIDDEQVKTAVIIYVPYGGAATAMYQCLCRTTFRIDFNESTVRCATEKHIRFSA